MLLTMIQRISLIVSAALACFTFVQHMKINDLEEQIFEMSRHAFEIETRLEEAWRAVAKAEADRARAYDEMRDEIRNEPAERDGEVAPALRDAIGRLK
ncbi:hypothetical protein IQ24_00359 [Paracoccus sulfuroxidans]|uniref:Uncharacterized protein n=2 Tax=Paracoccus sulfuroxidans TaxID=384678 RepID=A0A562P1K0_9RHOB|nr:hypothetical protein IQ24_00359 [Paracoccus sulfuroxidans]